MSKIGKACAARTPDNQSMKGGDALLSKLIRALRSSTAINLAVVILTVLLDSLRPKTRNNTK